MFKQNKRHLFCRKCYRCETFLTSEKQEREHNFLKHLQRGGEIPLEDRPIIIKNDGTITKFVIEYNKHKNSYDFEHPVKLVEDFFRVVDSKFVTDGKKEFIIKSRFAIQNYQPSPEDINNAVGIYGKKIWSTQTYFGRFFNEYIRVSLTNDIKKRITVNARTGSLWRFNRYDSISITFNTVQNQQVLRQ